MRRPPVLVLARLGALGGSGVAVAAVVWIGMLTVATRAGAQTAGLESPSLWLLIASVAQIVAAAGVVVFFITRGRVRRCVRCGQRIGRDAPACPCCGTGGRDAAEPARRGRVARHVTLLKGINVGAHKQVAMADCARCSASRDRRGEGDGLVPLGGAAPEDLAEHDPRALDLDMSRWETGDLPVVSGASARRSAGERPVRAPSGRDGDRTQLERGHQLAELLDG